MNDGNDGGSSVQDKVSDWRTVQVVSWALYPGLTKILRMKMVRRMNLNLQSQLQKHSREIVSHLGNLFMRATSAKIMKRVAEVPPRAVTRIADSTAFSPLFKMLRALSTTVDGQMRGFQVADAVETVVLALQEVRCASFPRVVLRAVR